MAAAAPCLIDAHGRRITYLRVSVTDRCDLRCRYCMAEEMTFLPRSALMTLEEIALIVDRFVDRGVRKVRLTGGEPLVRRDVIDLARRIGRHLGGPLDELTMTTNAMRLATHADALFAAGVRRINVSLDTLDPARFRDITRVGDLDRVLAGIAAAREAGLSVKINMVALKGQNDDEFARMLAWCGAHGHDLTLIETMPLGDIGEDRRDRFLPLGEAFAALQSEFTLAPDAHRSGGPARYWRVGEFGTRLGLITPLTENFCGTCNRVRLTTEGVLHACLGHADRIDLRAALREGGIAGVDAAIDIALGAKPLRHEFDLAAAAPAVARHMSVTGG